MINLTRREQIALGWESRTIDETPEEIAELAYNCWIVWDDAPFPYWERQKHMDALAGLARKIGHPFA